MSTLAQVIFFSLIGGIFSLAGGFVLLSNRKRAMRISKYATPFAAGAMLSAAFVDLLPEANHDGDIDKALFWALMGILGFFLLERFIHWFHHHHEHSPKSTQTNPNVALIVIGDTMHNFIDGIAIAAGFLANPETGITVTIAVAAHEIPQEIGDFGLLLSKGMRRRNVILVNFFSALATTVAAVLFFTLGESVEFSLDIALGLIAGFFIYIAVSDIIPSIHKNEEKMIAGPQTIMLVTGVVVVALATTMLHQYIDQGHIESDEAESSQIIEYDHHELEHSHDHSEEDH